MSFIEVLGVHTIPFEVCKFLHHAHETMNMLSSCSASH